MFDRSQWVHLNIRWFVLNMANGPAGFFHFALPVFNFDHLEVVADPHHGVGGPQRKVPRKGIIDIS